MGKQKKRTTNEKRVRRAMRQQLEHRIAQLDDFGRFSLRAISDVQEMIDHGEDFGTTRFLVEDKTTGVGCVSIRAHRQADDSPIELSPAELGHAAAASIKQAGIEAVRIAVVARGLVCPLGKQEQFEQWLAEVPHPTGSPDLVESIVIESFDRTHRDCIAVDLSDPATLRWQLGDELTECWQPLRVALVG